jgi:hypothetical protein
VGITAYEREPNAGDRIHGESLEDPDVAVPATYQDDVP